MSDRDESHPAGLAADRRPTPAGRVGQLRGARTSAPTCRSSRCSTSSTRGSIAEGEEPIAFDHDCREGICGSCGLMINGVAHGPIAARRPASCTCASFTDGDDDHDRAVARARVPGDEGSRRRPRRVRPHHRRRRLRLRDDRRRARTATPSWFPRSDADERDGRRRLHRLRRLRGRLPERLGVALHRRQDLAPRPAAAGPAGAAIGAR